MKKFILSLSTFALIAASIFVFSSCEKEENTDNASSKVQKAYLPQYNYYELVDEENGIYLNLEDMSHRTLSIQRIDTFGTAIVTWHTLEEDQNVKLPIYRCEGEGGTTCGHAKEEINGKVYYGHWYFYNEHITYLMDEVTEH